MRSLLVFAAILAVLASALACGDHTEGKPVPGQPLMPTYDDQKPPPLPPAPAK